MTSKNNPEATTQPAATEGNPPVVDGIIRLRDANGALHDYAIDDFSEEKAKEVFTLLPPIWQQKIEAQAAFFQNYSRTITDIPEELRAPGAIEKLFAEISKNGGYIADTTSPAVKEFLDGPATAELRSSGLYKGYKSADAISELIASGAKIVMATPGQYLDMLALPYRGAAYAFGWMGDKLSTMPTLTPEKAYTLATAYQGMMYMATESEFAPKETKTEAPGTVGTAVGGVQTAVNYVAVGGIAVWNLVKGWFTGEKVTWDQAWKDAENYWTDGKGLKSASENAQTNAVAASLEEVRPAVEQRLRETTIDGMDISAYLNLEEGALIADKDGNVSTFEGQDAGLKPVIGPDGTNQLNASDIEQTELDKVRGDLFKDWSATGLVASGTAAGAGALTLKGAAQGFARTTLAGDRASVEKAHEAAKASYFKAKKALEDFENKAEHKNWRGKPLSDEAVEAARKKLTEALDKAMVDGNRLGMKLNEFAHDPISDAKASKNPFTKLLGNLAEGANKTLPDDAKLVDRTVNRLTALGRGPGAIAASVSGWGTNFAGGIARGAADAISPDERGPSVKPLFGQKAKEGAEAIRKLGEVEPTTNMGKLGKFFGKWGTGLSGVLTFAQPVVGLSTSEDAVGTATYSASTAGLAGAVWAAGGKQLGLKALGVGMRRIVPGAGLAMDGVDYLDGARTDNAQKKRDAAVSAATQGVGAAIGGAIGGAIGFFGGFGVGAAPGAIAGATIGTTVAGFASMATVPLANRLWPVKTEPKAADRSTPAPQVAAVVDARQASLSNEETVAALMAQNQLLMQQLQMATGRVGTGKTGFDAAAFARVSSNSAGAARQG